jgi:hypothetical protein
LAFDQLLLELGLLQLVLQHLDLEVDQLCVDLLLLLLGLLQQVLACDAGWVHHGAGGNSLALRAPWLL